MTRALLITTAILSGILLFTWRQLRQERSDRQRLEDNQTALISENLFYRTSEGKSAASVQALTLKIGEYEALMARDAEKIRSLGIKINRLQSMSETATDTQVRISVPVRDTTLTAPGDSLPELARKFTWADPHVSVSGIIRADSVDCVVRSRDTLLQVAYRVPRKFLFIRWGTKAIRQEIVSSNPHTTINYSKYIILQ